MKSMVSKLSMSIYLPAAVYDSVPATVFFVAGGYYLLGYTITAVLLLVYSASIFGARHVG